jgi:cell division protein FtsQ
MSTTGPDSGARVAIDPRMRARLIAVRRDAGRRRLRRLAVVVTGAAVAVIGWLLTLTPLLDVDRVEVGGAIRLTPDGVRAVSGLDRGDPLLRVDTGDVAQRVERLPWVSDAKVERRFPGTVAITVVEREPAAVVSHGGQLALADEHGRILDSVASAPRGLVVVDLAAAVPAPGERVPSDVRGALELATRAADELPSAVQAVRADSGGVALALAEGGSVHLGSLDDLDAKLMAVAAVVDQVDLRCLAVLDVRVPASPALTRQPGCL